MEIEEIGTCTAILYKVQTMASGGARITLDLTAQDAKIVARLIELDMMARKLLKVGIISIEEFE